MSIIDYDQIRDWAPWFGELVNEIAGEDLAPRLRSAQPEFIEDARDLVVDRIGKARLIAQLNERLTPHFVRVFHGTRVTEGDEKLIRLEGLKALNLIGRREGLIAIFSQHPQWPTKADRLEALLLKYGAGWKQGGAGRREDNSVHVCLSRAGLLYGCSHYLEHGAEVDFHIAQELFDVGGPQLLTRNRRAKLVSFTAPFEEAAIAANPYGWGHNLPSLLGKLVAAWAYKQARPTFEVKQLHDDVALKFSAPIEPHRFDRIEDVDDAVLFSSPRAIR